MPGKMVSQPAGSSNGLAPVPSLAEVQRDPAMLEALSVAAIVALRRQVSHLAADLDAAFCQAITQASDRHPRSEPTADRLLTPEAAAERFGVTKRWLLDHADQIAGVRRLSRKTVRFSERHLDREIARQARCSRSTIRRRLRTAVSPSMTVRRSAEESEMYRGPLETTRASTHPPGAMFALSPMAIPREVNRGKASQ